MQFFTVFSGPNTRSRQSSRRQRTARGLRKLCSARLKLFRGGCWKNMRFLTAAASTTPSFATRPFRFSKPNCTMARSSRDRNKAADSSGVVSCFFWRAKAFHSGFRYSNTAAKEQHQCELQPDPGPRTNQ